MRQKRTLTVFHLSSRTISLFQEKIRSARCDFFFSLKQIPSGCCNSRILQGWMPRSSIFSGIEIKLDNLEKKRREALCKRKTRTLNRHVLLPYSLIPNKTHTDNCATRALQ